VIPEVKCKIFNNLPWHSQKDMANFLGKSVKTINEHLSYSQWKPTLLRVTNTEGTRAVERLTQYYPFDCMASLSYRAGSFLHVDKYRAFLRELGIVFPETVLIPCDEKNFEAYLSQIFSGILDIKFQHYIGPYRVNGFVESLKIIFELDGQYHDNLKQRELDKERESYLKTQLPDFKIIRADWPDFSNIANSLIKKLIDGRKYGSKSRKFKV
jgi:very-short-patch-repair endonuclease